MCTGDGPDLGRSFKRIPCMEVQQPAHNTPVGPNVEQEARPSCVRNLFCLVPSCLDTLFFSEMLEAMRVIDDLGMIKWSTCSLDNKMFRITFQDIKEISKDYVLIQIFCFNKVEMVTEKLVA